VFFLCSVIHNFLTPVKIEELKRLNKTSDRKKADKIKSIILLNKGYEFTEIADILMLDDSTIRRWYIPFQDEGIEELLRYNYLGSESKLIPEQVESPDKHLEGTIYLSAKEIFHFIEKTFSVQYTIPGVTNLLHKLEYTYKKPKHVPGKLNPQAQEAFIKQYTDLKENKNTDDRIWFIDAFHTLHNSQPVYGWMKKGLDYTIESNTGRQRVNIN
jgi:transposase